MKPRRVPIGIGAFTTLGLVTGILLVVRLWLDSHLELMYNEAYYALWAKHLAWGYFDHPPMVALWIRLSTICFGDHEFGVRALGTLSATAETALIYLLSWHLFGRRSEAIFAALLFCAMLLISAGAIIIAPDTPLVFFWSIALYALVRIFCGGGSGWWWLIGIAMGLALQSKYTALLLGAGIVGAMAVVPRLRHWWRNPMPYIAGALALAIFVPVVAWNYEHGWASFGRQFSRAQIDGLSLRYLAEFLGSQLGLLTPFVFVLAVGGVWLALRRRDDENGDAYLFLVSLVAPMLFYFLFHSLHARVHGNWVAPAYPVLAVLGAEAAFLISSFSERVRPLITLSRHLSVPVGLSIAGIAYLQAWAAPIPINPAVDPIAVIAGWSDLAASVDNFARREGAAYILTSSYALTSEMMYYSTRAIPVIQYNERLRWVSFEQPKPNVLSRPALYLADANRDLSNELTSRFSRVIKISEISRARHGKQIQRYVLYRLESPVAPILSGNAHHQKRVAQLEGGDPKAALVPGRGNHGSQLQRLMSYR